MHSVRCARLATGVRVILAGPREPPCERAVRMRAAVLAGTGFLRLIEQYVTVHPLAAIER